MKILAIIGKKCTGKTVLAEYLGELDSFNTIVTYTTRNPRDGELKECKYHFTDEETINKMSENNELIEYNNRNGVLYATTRKSLVDDKVNIIVIDLEGVQELKKQFSDKLSIVKLTCPQYPRMQRYLNRKGYRGLLDLTSEDWDVWDFDDTHFENYDGINLNIDKVYDTSAQTTRDIAIDIKEWIWHEI